MPLKSGGKAVPLLTIHFLQSSIQNYIVFLDSIIVLLTDQDNDWVAATRGLL